MYRTLRAHRVTKLTVEIFRNQTPNQKSQAKSQTATVKSRTATVKVQIRTVTKLKLGTDKCQPSKNITRQKSRSQIQTLIISRKT